MKQLYDDLWQTALEKPFTDLNTHAYVLTRQEGNVLFYNTSNAANIEQIRELGGITHQYLSHRHEAGPSLAIIKDTFGSALCADWHEAPFVRT